MDFTFFAYGALAALIAIVLSSIELLTKYQARNLREIFFSSYYVGFALLNGLFCFLVYWSLPFLGSVAIKSDLLSSINQPLSRALVAGFGYLLIARTSILDVTVRGETLGVGFDAAYKTVAQYLLRHHNAELNRGTREAFREVYAGPADDIVFLNSIKLLIAQQLDNDKIPFQNQLSLALDGNPPSDVLCLTLYNLLRELSTGKDDVKKQIETARTGLENNDQLAARLKEELPWLYP